MCCQDCFILWGRAKYLWRGAGDSVLCGGIKLGRSRGHAVARSRIGPVLDWSENLVVRWVQGVRSAFADSFFDWLFETGQRYGGTRLVRDRTCSLLDCSIERKKSQSCRVWFVGGNVVRFVGRNADRTCSSMDRLLSVTRGTCSAFNLSVGRDPDVIGRSRSRLVQLKAWSVANRTRSLFEFLIDRCGGTAIRSPSATELVFLLVETIWLFETQTELVRFIQLVECEGTAETGLVLVSRSIGRIVARKMEKTIDSYRDWFRSFGRDPDVISTAVRRAEPVCDRI